MKIVTLCRPCAEKLGKDTCAECGRRRYTNKYRVGKPTGKEQ